MRIALLVPDRDQAEQVMEWLSCAGAAFSCCSDGEELLGCLVQDDYAAVVLDGSDQRVAKRLLRSLRQTHPGLPVLWLALPEMESAIVEAMALGVDDYLFKPFTCQELLARIRVLTSLRNAAGSGAASLKPLHCPPYLIDYQQRQILRNDKALVLTGKDFSLAAYMFEHQGQLLTRQQLLEDVWGLSNQVNTRTVDMHMSRVRKALELQGTPYEIKTIHQQGYRLERQ